MRPLPDSSAFSPAHSAQPRSVSSNDVRLAAHRAERLAALLLSQGLISSEQLRIAAHEQQLQQQSLEDSLVQLGFISTESLRDALASVSGHPAIDLSQLLIDAGTLALIPLALARRHQLLPLAFCPVRRQLRLALADANDLVALDRLRALLGAEIELELRIASPTELERAIEQHYGKPLSADALLEELEAASPAGIVQGKQNAARTTTAAEPVTAIDYGQQLIRTVDALIAEAVGRGASDLHFEPEAAYLRIRERIDGILHQTRVLHKRFWPELAVRLKVIAGLDIAETRLPQDGRLSLNLGGRQLDFRVATQPTLHGENIVLRILDRDKGIVPLERLGLGPAQQQALQRMLARPEGLILVTGPTGSGKTTTLYSILQHLNESSVNIMTLEDPVEYPLPRIRQSMVGEGSRLGFADGVRALLRQDPDIILIGEIRDADTAHMALRAALTGHRVFATLHANSALGTLPRLLDIGLRADLLAGNLSGIIAQRLVRKLCPACCRPAAATPALAALLKRAGSGLAHRTEHTQTEEPTPAATAQALPPGSSYHAVGCASCHFSGYRGRLALLELLCIDEELDALIGSGAPLADLRAALRARQHADLAAAGLACIAAGMSSVAEVQRVVDLGELAELAELAEHTASGQSPDHPHNASRQGAGQ